MTKIAVIGDMHMGIKGGDKHFLEFQMAWLEYVLKKLESMGIDTIIQTGDFFDTRAHIKLNVLHKVLTWFPDVLRSHGIKDWIVYGGNHDMFYRDSNEVSSLEIFKVLHEAHVDSCINFTVYDTDVGHLIFDGCKIAFVPWLNKNNEKRLLEDVAALRPDYVFGHFEMEGMPMIPGGAVCEHGLKVKDFKDYKRVISGHFHTISHQQNCTMVGSPYHLNWGDVGDKRGFWILDTDKDTFELVENEEHMTMFSVIEYDPNLKYTDDSFEAYEGTIVKVLVKSKTDEKHYKKFTDILAKTKFLEYKVIDLSTVEIEKVQISEEVLQLDTATALSKYIDMQGDEVDKEPLKALAAEIYMETLADVE